VMTAIRRSSILLTAILLTAACGNRDDGTADGSGAAAAPGADSGAADPAAPPAAPRDTQRAAPPSQRPATRADTVMIEGMAQVDTSRLYTTPAGFALPFSTYVPEGLQVQTAARAAVRFIAAFAGTVNENAFMVLHIQDPGAAQRDAESILRDLMQTRSAAQHERVSMDRPSWAVAAVGFRSVGADGTRFTGSIAVGEHGDRYFHVIRHYPVEYGDGLPPRLHSILRHWRWEDTGAPLMR
jgi:hypothetical protein